jgi:hypothetical protein
MLMDVNPMSGTHDLSSDDWVTVGSSAGIHISRLPAGPYQNGYAGTCDRVVIHCHSLN